MVSILSDVPTCSMFQMGNEYLSRHAISVCECSRYTAPGNDCSDICRFAFYSLLPLSFLPRRVNLYVEDHKQNVGPIRISVCHEWRVGELRAKIERDFGFPSNVQKWIIGKSLIEDNSRTLYELGVKKNGAKIFLIIAPQGTTLAVFS